MAGRRRIELNDSLEERAGFRQQATVRGVLPGAIGLARQRDLRLRELEQRTGVRIQRVSRALEVPVGGAGVPQATGQNGCVDGVLTERHGTVALEQLLRLSLLTCLQQDVDQRVRDVRYRAGGPLCLERLKDVLGADDLAPLRVQADHLRREDGRSRVRRPCRLDAPDGFFVLTQGPQVGHVSQRRERSVFRMSGQRSLKERPLLTTASATR